MCYKWNYLVMITPKRLPLLFYLLLCVCTRGQRIIDIAKSPGSVCGLDLDLDPVIYNEVCSLESLKGHKCLNDFRFGYQVGEVLKAALKALRNTSKERRGDKE